MEYRTSDIQVAAFLYAEGMNFLYIDHSNGKRKEFVFEKEKTVEELVKNFWSETQKIAPRKYMGAFKELKNKLYQ